MHRCYSQLSVCSSSILLIKDLNLSKLLPSSQEEVIYDPIAVSNHMESIYSMIHAFHWFLPKMKLFLKMLIIFFTLKDIYNAFKRIDYNIECIRLHNNHSSLNKQDFLLIYLKQLSNRCSFLLHIDI